MLFRQQDTATSPTWQVRGTDALSLDGRGCRCPSTALASGPLWTPSSGSRCARCTTSARALSCSPKQRSLEVSDECEFMTEGTRAFVAGLTEKPALVRNGKDLPDQFDCRYRTADDGSASAYFIKFRQSLSGADVVLSKPDDGVEKATAGGVQSAALGEFRTSLLKYSYIKRFSLQFGRRDKLRGRAERRPSTLRWARTQGAAG